MGRGKKRKDNSKVLYAIRKAKNGHGNKKENHIYQTFCCAGFRAAISLLASFSLESRTYSSESTEYNFPKIPSQSIRLTTFPKENINFYSPSKPIIKNYTIEIPSNSVNLVDAPFFEWAEPHFSRGGLEKSTITFRESFDYVPELKGKKSLEVDAFLTPPGGKFAMKRFFDGRVFLFAERGDGNYELRSTDFGGF